MTYKGLLLSLLLLGLGGSVLAQVPDLGAPFITNYETEQFKMSNQNWISVQDRRGVMYFGNTMGILEFDGQRWQRILVPGDATVRAMALGPDGTIYYGTTGDIGYLAASPSGKVTAISLKAFIPEEERTFNDIWQVASCVDGIYFLAPGKVFRFHSGRVTVMSLKNDPTQACVMKGALFVNDQEKGLCLIDGDRIVPILALAGVGDGKPMTLAAFGPNELLVVRRSGAFFRIDLTPLWDETSGHYLPSRSAPKGFIKPFPTELEALVKANPGFIYTLTPLGVGTYAICTLKAGVIIFDRSGRIVRAITKHAGLLDNSVSHALADRAGNLWLAGLAGISHVEWSLPQSIFGPAHGVEGIPTTTQFHEGRFYVGTFQKLFVQTPHRFSLKQDQPAFVAVKGSPGEVYQLQVVDGDLMAATGEGLFRIHGDRAMKVPGTPPGAACLSSSNRWPGHLFVGFMGGLEVFRRSGGQWMRVGPVEGVRENITCIVEDAEGDLWLATEVHGLLRLHGTGGNPLDLAVHRIGLEQGLPQLTYLRLAATGSDLLVTTTKGLYRATPQPWQSVGSDLTRFLPDRGLGKGFQDPPVGLDNLMSDGKGGFLFVTSEGGMAWLRPDKDGSFSATTRPFKGLSSAITTAYPHPDGSLWFPGKVLYRIDPEVTKDYDQRFNVLIRKVVTHNSLVVFEGSHAQENPAHWFKRTQFQSAQRQDETPNLPYPENDLTFEFTATFFEKPGTTRFQYLLEGFDKDWSAWSDGTVKEYTNIPEGRYRFRVRARNLYGTLGDEAVYAFRIRPPWFRTLWARLLWVLCGIGAVAGIIALYTRNLRQQKHRLEEMVAQRTQQLQEATLTDPLTGLRNRRFISEVLMNDIEAFVGFKTHVLKSRSTRESRTDSEIMGVFLLDMDHFKKVNDTHGHEAGDRVLKQFARLLKELVRKDDVVIRLGGEEFLVVLKKIKPDFLSTFATKMLERVAAHAFELGEGTTLQKTCSIGYVGFPIYHEYPSLLTFEQSLQVADLGMYYAKHHGRNRAVQLVEGPHMPLEAEALTKALASLDFALSEGHLKIE